MTSNGHAGPVRFGDDFGAPPTEYCVVEVERSPAGPSYEDGIFALTQGQHEIARGNGYAVSAELRSRVGPGEIVAMQLADGRKVLFETGGPDENGSNVVWRSDREA